MLTKAGIEKYFIAEKNESLVFIVIGVLAILAAMYFIFIQKTAFAKGIAIPLIAIAFIEITVGWTVFRRSDKDRIDMVYALDMNPGILRTEEIPRMQKVLDNFRIYRWVEISLAITGLLLILFCRTKTEWSFWYGIGVGLAIQALLMLVADFFAEKRAWLYFESLNRLI